ncbi:DUF2993 domain-containing protein [Aetokthonos hydrillicola Thurmond2011]|jgi:hypothetical protein|uniref:DUF2993 domain-containing protein n=1 Tax=Aetokthonos hydrillicola Thurmond2011 TaxID=2712845 RepID=A0AAP5I3X2_9CYAN|nr:DUF2993 domain-containing protein [Aetokthonos hydrillicola]MBO3458576.1 DUF2993 domain-containing protein [Aetokthonos hydrillicola CCALA 1050]MBW4585019.1 DUF2993 domain-containing protein [Aetokthonos hydrillicola CCALA 1050]MDR9894220.1 DUF2993 domain-containing protein [Aetokthonos hydrillicola Thurmond2011]
MPDEQRLEAQILSKEAERRLSDQLDKSEDINVDVQTDLLKIFQGKMDGVYLSGKGLVFKGIRLQDIKLQTDSLAVNPFSALFGEIQLDQPVNATVSLTLTDSDINSALKSDVVSSKISKLDLNVDGEIVSLEPQEIQIFLPGNNKMAFAGKIYLQKNDDTRLIGFTACIRPRTNKQPIILESFQITEGEGISLETVTSLIEMVKKLVNLPYLEFEDTAVRIKNMQVGTGNLTLLVEARVGQIPST